jgi:hypothetical protein
MKSKSSRYGQRGAVMMEYVIVGVLIAAACILGVVVLGRSVFYGLDLGAKGATADSAKVKKGQTQYRTQLDEDTQGAKEYHDSMHTGKSGQP